MLPVVPPERPDGAMCTISGPLLKLLVELEVDENLPPPVVGPENSE